MKKLKKLSLKQMEKEMPVLNKGAQEKLSGGYQNDCFWRCVSYLEGGGGTEINAEYWADQYYNYALSCSGITASDYYNNNAEGAEMYTSDIQNYTSFRTDNGTYSYSDITASGYIGMFNTADNVGSYANTGTRHAIVITCVNPNDTADYYDPQLNISGTLSASDLGKIDRAMY